MINLVSFWHLSLNFLTFGHWQDCGTSSPLHAHDLISDVTTVWMCSSVISATVKCWTRCLDSRQTFCVTNNLNNGCIPCRWACPLHAGWNIRTNHCYLLHLLLSLHQSGQNPSVIKFSCAISKFFILIVNLALPLFTVVEFCIGIWFYVSENNDTLACDWGNTD